MNAELVEIAQNNTLSISTATLVSEWLEYERGEGASENTLTAYRRGLMCFVTWLRDRGLAGGSITSKVVRTYKTNLLQTYGPQTVNLRLAALRSFFRFLVSTDRLDSNPAAAVKGARRAKSRLHRRDALTNGEVVAVLQTCDPSTAEGARDRAILTLMAYCGLREIEIHRANIGNLKTQGERLVLEVHGKGRLEADAVTVIPTRQEPVIRAWLVHRMSMRDHGSDAPLFTSFSNRSRGQRLSLRAIRAAVKARYRAAGVVGTSKTAHSLRHSAITNAIRRGATPMQVQAMARHGSFDTTLTYYHEAARVDNPAEDLISYGGEQESHT